MIFAVLVLASGVSPVQKVIELCTELKGKVQGDLATEEKLMGEYTAWCDSESNEKEDAITSGKRTVGDLAATIKEASASVQTLTAETEELAAKISTADADLKSASDVRAKEHEDFAAAEAELVDTIDTLSRASIVLKRGQSFLQKGGKQQLAQLASSLGKIVEASWVSSSQKAKVQALLQAGTEDEDLSLQPQATTDAYESQGGSILDVLADMQEKAEASLSSARKDEMQASHAFEMLKQSLETELKTMTKRMSEASATKAASEETKASSTAELSDVQASVASDEKYLAELKQSCASKSAEWDARQKSAGEEMAAIDKAIEILSEGVKVFLQVEAKTGVKDDKRGKVVELVRALAAKDHTYALAQLASAAQSDPFGKIRGLVESMISRLEQQAAEEADAKSFCDAETSKSKAKQAELTAASDKHAARIEEASASKAALEQETKELQAAIAEMDAAQAEATKIRTSEHDEYVKSSKDQKESAEAVANAIQVLGDYYNGASFLQLSAKQAPDFNAAKTDVASTIMSMLEVAESDFTKMLAENEAQESAAKSTYDKLVQDNAVTRSAKQAEIRGNESELKSLAHSLVNYKEDQATTGEELDAVLAYLEKLKPQCETKVMSYAERKARREEEIEGLKQALEILSA